ncbi:MAG: tetratricopeptide repeat protein [Nanoarchaeota archaeon]|nr:tetratricopeptide repeat protein [Nanoarchaeota archaeon]
MARKITSSEIYHKLDLLKTNEAKLSYLKEIESDIDLMDSSAQDSFYSQMGSVWIGKGDIHKAKRFYEKIKDKKTSREGFTKVGDYALFLGWMKEAEKYYVKARDKKNLGILGDIWLRYDGDIHDIIRVYEKAGDKKRLRKVGDVCVERGKIAEALRVYRKVGDKKGLRKVGDSCFEKGEFEYATHAYEKLIEMGVAPEEIINKAADAYEKQGLGNSAIKTRAKAERIKRRKLKRISLENKVTASIALAGVVSGLIFLSPNLTGNVIGNLSNSSSNIIGGVLFLIGLVGAFFSIRGR